MNNSLKVSSFVLHGRMKGLASMALRCGVLGLWVMVSLVWATPAGTVIRNQAAAQVGGQTYLSNEVETLVQAVCIASITPSGSLLAPSQQAVISAGGLAYFSLRSAELPNPLLSQPVNLNVSASVLLLQKAVTPVKATVGDLLTYTLSVASQGKSPLTVQITDTPSAGLAYVEGSATPGEPVQQGGQLVWSNVSLNPGQPLTLTYQMRVLSGAPSQLENLARATGISSGGAAVASAQASAAVQLEPGVFAPANLLLGRVFLDTDGDGKYTAGVDIPLAGARVLLANGWQALTDAEGRYSFRDLVGGVWEVTLDPASAPFQPLPHPEAMGNGYRHKVLVSGLTVSDFPLVRPTGLGTVSRETVLEFGSLKVSKKLLPLPEGVRVVLSLSSSAPLNDLTLSDPLPGGGAKLFHFDQFQGEQTLTYDLPAGSPLTDPQARWRYP